MRSQYWCMTVLVTASLLHAGAPDTGELHSARMPATQRGGSKPAVSFIVVPLGDADFNNVDRAVTLQSGERGALFDIDGDGVLDRVSWPSVDANLAFLAIDRNHNNQIDNGRELFGAQTLADATDGFTALARIEPTNVGWVSRGDPVFSRLLLWADRNANGRSEQDELRPAMEMFARIGLGYFGIDHRGPDGTVVANRGWSITVADFKDKADDPIRPFFEVVPVVRIAPKREP